LQSPLAFPKHGPITVESTEAGLVVEIFLGERRIAPRKGGLGAIEAHKEKAKGFEKEASSMDCVLSGILIEAFER
jgi:hypothetical protein